MAIARVPDFQSRLYKPFVDKNISFQISTTDLEDLVIEGTKLPLVDVNIKYNNNTFKVISSEKIENELVRKKVYEFLRYKAEIVIGTEIKTWLKDYSFIEEQNGWYIYENNNDLLDNKSVRLKYYKNKITIKETTPIGSSTTIFDYKEVKWSDKLVLNKVTKRDIDGNQKNTTVTTFIYSKFKTYFYISKIKSELTQVVDSSLGTPLERRIKEAFYIKNFKILD